MLHEYATHARDAARELLTALDQLHRELDEVGLPHVAERIAEYAWGGHAFDSDAGLLNAMHDLSSANEVCGGNLMLPSGDDLLAQENKTLLRQLMNAADARMALDNGESIRVEGLAALARVAEKTVRMATNPSRPGSIRVRKEGHWAYIDAPEALAWLQRRDDFQPTHKHKLKSNQAPISKASDLASTCMYWRKQKGMDVDRLGKSLKWTAAQRKAYLHIESGELTDQMTRFPPKTLHALGEAIGIPQPNEFAREAFNVLAAEYAKYLSDHQLTKFPH